MTRQQLALPIVIIRAMAHIFPVIEKEGWTITDFKLDSISERDSIWEINFFPQTDTYATIIIVVVYEKINAFTVKLWTQMSPTPIIVTSAVSLDNFSVDAYKIKKHLAKLSKYQSS